MLDRTDMNDARAGADTLRTSLNNDALLLDIDGTLLDIAPTPEQVVVPQDLHATLVRLGERNAALAVVSGRTVESVDRTFAPLRLPAIGCHGAQFRLEPEKPAVAMAPVLPESIRRLFKDLPALEPGADMEDKGFTIVFHYRAIPERGLSLLHLVRERMRGAPPEFEIMRGKATVEIKSRAFTKGKAVAKLMAQAPFLGRRPVYLGDDTTDEDVFAILPQLGGIGISVGRQLKGADGVMTSPQSVRNWLAELAQKGEA